MGTMSTGVTVLAPSGRPYVVGVVCNTGEWAVTLRRKNNAPGADTRWHWLPCPKSVGLAVYSRIHAEAAARSLGLWPPGYKAFPETNPFDILGANANP